MKLILGNILHCSGPDVNHPAWDTLIGLVNMETQPVTARFRLVHEAVGMSVMWPSGKDDQDVLLEPGCSFAATFIPGNGFLQPPQDFMGHAEIECLRSGPFGPISADRVYAWAMASGGNWDELAPSIEVPVLRPLPDSTVINPSEPFSRWVFPYCIPHYANAEHAGPKGYTTGITVQNLSPFPVTVTFTYVVNQCYPEKGFSWSFMKTIPAHGGVRFPLYEALVPAGYPPSLNSEGHLLLTSNPSAILIPSAIIATADYVFSAGELAQRF